MYNKQPGTRAFEESKYVPLRMKKVKIGENLCDICLGSEPRFSLQDRILNAVLLVTSIVAFISLILDVISSLSWDPDQHNYVYTFLLTAIFGLLYYYGRRRPCSTVLLWPYLILILSAPVLAWWLMGGFTGTCLLFAIPIMLVIPLITQGYRRAMAIGLVFTVVAALYFLELTETVRIEPYQDHKLELFDNLLAFVFVTMGYNLVISLVLRASNRKQNRIEELNRTKDKFLSIIGHDLRGPLGNLKSMSEILMRSEGDLDPSTKEKLLLAIHSSSQNSFKLVDNLLLWARSSSGMLLAQPTRILLDPKVQEVVELMRDHVNGKELDLSLRLESGAHVWADSDMLDTVIRNLMSNAVKFTPNKGTIEVATTLDLKRHFGSVIVRDNGLGMTPEVADQLMNFESSHTTPGTNNEMGTGLGLKLCKEFIDKNKGTISVESELNVGTRFTVSLPLDQ